MGIRTIIMAGGRGRRLAPLTDFIPKPLVTVANVPLLGITIDHLVQMGFDDVDISVGYMADKICDYVGRNYKTGIRTHKEKEPRGTAGCVRDVPRTKHGDTLVVSGDILFDLDLSRAVDFHAGSGAAATVVLTRKSDPCRYGTVTLGPSGIITGFREKPEWKNVNSDLVSTGIYVVSDEVLKMIPGKGECDFARDVFPHLVGHGLYGIELDGYWNDVGTPEDYRTANLDAATGKVDSVDRALHHSGDDTQGDQGGDDGLDNEIITVDLTRVDSRIDQIFFFLNNCGKEDFSQIPYASIRMYEGTPTKVKNIFARYDVAAQEQYVGMTALIMGKLYRRGGEWKFNAIGDAYPDPNLCHTIIRILKQYTSKKAG